MPNAYNYSNAAQPTTLAGSITSGATTFNVNATAGFPAVPFILALDYGASTEELVKVTAISGNTITNCDRGFGGTSAQSHSLGAAVRHVYNSVDATDFRTHEAASAAVHGLAGTVVGTTDTQTLTNKTLTSPTVNSGALSGTFTGAPTFSGGVTLTSPTINGGALSGTLTGSPTFTGSPVFSTGAPDFQNGFDWGGSTITGNATVSGANTFISSQSFKAGADTGDRLTVGSTGTLSFGSGTGVTDTFVQRVGSGLLQISGLVVAGNLSVGGVGQVQRLIKSSDTPRASTITPALDSVLFGNVVSGATYFFDCWVMLGDNAAGADFQATFGGTSTGTLYWSGAGAHNSLTTGSQADGEWIARNNVTTATPYATSATASVALGVRMTGSYVCSGDGTFGLQWSQQNSSATATVLKTGSWLRIERAA